jgi:hypothetical protein
MTEKGTKVMADVSGFQQLADEDLDSVCGGFNPQPDPPARYEIASTTLTPSNAVIVRQFKA